ncbi:hypothetical protein PS862_04049 [Pseudomonas fluorescens]|uniref:Uncharacterized protein n=1 Tax=Pseudomonas fluorescens TaxID=294 RepID=A0A5E7MK13_PSEFL|nr:hypothetical protein [Pseudomonas fluorescens]VVP24893.1 hypothetical protein PS862_04049 [Pseudomonas fluorescens]
MATLTPNAVQQSLQNNGLAALGLTTVALGTRWADVTPGSGDFDSIALTLAIAGTVRAPFLGIRENLFRDASSTLATAAPANATTLALAVGTGSSFPAPVTPGRILLTLSDSSGSKQEVVECTQLIGDSLTVVRGALGTAKQAFGDGDRVTLRLTPAQRVGAFYDVNGAPLDVNATGLRLHPQAAVRLQTICTARYAPAGQPLTLPLPATLLVQGAAGFRASRWYRADETLDDASGAISFHDARGFIIDPIYVAGLFADLSGAGALPGLIPPAVTAAANGPGGVQSIAGLAAADVRVHFIDPHGNAPRIASPGAGLITDDGAGTSTGTVSGNLITLATGNRIAANASAATTPLRFGFATNGTLSANPLAIPALANGAIARRFYRMMVVDQPWYLLGNRTGAAVLGVLGDDGRIPSDLLPAVRDQVDIDYLADGPDMLAEATRILTRPSQSMIVSVSPNIDQTLITPALPGAQAHWPTFPAVNTNAPFPAPPVRLTSANVSAAFAGKDVVVTLAAGAAPDGATVRIFTQRFVEIASINGAEPSFVRADGGSNIVNGASAVNILLRNPFNLGAAQPLPNPALLTMDIVVAPRVGRRRLTGAVAVNVAAGPASPPTDPFFGPASANIMGIMPISLQGVSEAPLFGIPSTTAPPPAPPATLRDLVLSLASEPSPRKAPRLPTMGRLETVAVTGTTSAGALPAGSLLWQAVLSGARWAAESRSAQHADGNPGNPAGPDVHAPGVAVTGALAYDLALHALKRAQPLIPLPASNAGTVQGWLVTSMGDNFDVPSDSANVVNTGSGVLLQSIAVGCETPWLATFTPPPANNTIDQMIQSAATAIGVPAPALTVTVNNEPRLQREVRREFFAAKQGFRDAQWSLRRAFAEARELVYIESPQFARTAHATGTPQPFEVDLVAELAARLVAQPNLHVIVCTPRLSDFADSYKTFHRQHYAARMEAFGNLQAAARDRVLLFHPVGFPGRAAYIRTTSVIVDDVWCLVGATHFRRRGMTFDGSAAIASFDRQITDGYSTKVRNYRRALMAAKMNVPAPAAGQALSGEWVRLGRPVSAFDVVNDLLRQGGYGRIQSIWPGPPASDNSVLAAQPEVADPDGSNGVTLFNTLAGMLNELGT